MMVIQHFSIAAPSHVPGSTSNAISPHETSFLSQPFRLCCSTTAQRAQSATSPLASLPCDMKSSSPFNSTDSLKASTNETFSPFDPIGTLEFDNELVVDPHESDIEYTTISQNSFSTLKLHQFLQRQLNAELSCTYSQFNTISKELEETISHESQSKATTSSTMSQSQSDPAQNSISEDSEAVDDMMFGRVEDEGFCEGEALSDGEINTESLLISLRQAMGVRRQDCTRSGVFAKPRIRRKIKMRKRPENHIENVEQTEQ